MNDRKIVQVTVLRSDSCGDNYSCPAITDIGDPEFLYFIATPVTDPEVLAAHASRMAPDERLYRFPRKHIPEVTA